MTMPLSAMSCDEVRDVAPLYVVGALDVAEAAAVRDHVASCPEQHQEIAEFGSAVQMLLLAQEPAAPSAGLRDRLLAAAAADLAEGRHPATAGAAANRPDSAAALLPSPRAVPQPVSRPIDLASRRRVPMLRVALALAAAVIVALGGLGLRLQQDLRAAQAYRDGVSAVLALAAQPGSQAALLTANDGSVSGLGVVGTDGTVKIAMRGLSATTGSQVYAAWSIAGGGAPVPIGEFTVGSDGTAVATAHAPVPAPGVVLALTLEAHAGATTPSPLVVAKGVARPPAG